MAIGVLDILTVIDPDEIFTKGIHYVHRIIEYKPAEEIADFCNEECPELAISLKDKVK